MSRNVENSCKKYKLHLFKLEPSDFNLISKQVETVNRVLVKDPVIKSFLMLRNKLQEESLIGLTLCVCLIEAFKTIKKLRLILEQYAMFVCMLCPGPKVIKHFSSSSQLRMKFILLINVKMLTIVGILTFISRINAWL